MVCLLIAIISSYKLLAVPDLKPGDIAPFESIAAKDALVIDSAALQQKRSDLIPLTSVQVIDQKESQKLLKELVYQLKELELLATNDADRIGPVNLTRLERKWLAKQSIEKRASWSREIIEVAEKMLSQGLIKTLAQDQLKSSAYLQLSSLKGSQSESKTIGSKLIANTFNGKSNLRHDSNRSQQLLEELITKQGIPKIEVKKGDLITRKGETINQKRYDVLDYFGLINRRAKPIEWFWSFTEAFLSCLILLMVMRRDKPSLKPKHALLALGLLLIAQLSKDWFGAAISPLQILVPPTLLLSQGIGTASALGWLAIGSLLWPVPVSGIGEGRLIIAALTASLVAFQGGRMRSRAQLLQIAVLLPVSALLLEWILIRNKISPSDSAWGRLAPNSEALITEALVLGAMLMITILLLPILESTFGLLTRARLLELADQERPLLRKLSKEAPGTFEHTLMICSLAEEGARSIGADTDLVRTGGLYHDIGKLHAPNWFIENQEEGKNPHDELNDPYKSAEILQAHVDEGLRMAKRYRLPTAIADFIPEHQGTLKMGFFLQKAKEVEPSASEKNFRYKGPIPQTQETAILMLADGCEASLRALNLNSNEKEADATIRKIVESRETDGQLINSGLSKAEIELIINSFINVWKRMRHRRIKYPIYTKKPLFTS
ncbi:HDIG domain-containing metalloprotein [Prochlorococcus marinus]|uniref:HDIG domain-containing metalloprotein n=1 Tax=Prochlorococcus marinus TaxID=1219 RepID=UPI0022B56A96|nr:HDIG domain-containing metalloprotein [Prochlorococcus marinus]